MISLAKTKFILLMAIASSTGALLSMENDQIKVINFLHDKSIRARIPCMAGKLSTNIGPERSTVLVKFSPEDKTPLKLSIYEQDNTRQSIKLTLEKNQTSIAVLKSDSGQIVVKDNQTRKVLATL